MSHGGRQANTFSPCVLNGRRGPQELCEDFLVDLVELLEAVVQLFGQGLIFVGLGPGPRSLELVPHLLESLVLTGAGLVLGWGSGCLAGRLLDLVGGCCLMH